MVLHQLNYNLHHMRIWHMHKGNPQNRISRSSRASCSLSHIPLTFHWSQMRLLHVKTVSNYGFHTQVQNASVCSNSHRFFLSGCKGERENHLSKDRNEQDTFLLLLCLLIMAKSKIYSMCLLHIHRLVSCTDTNEICGNSTLWAWPVASFYNSPPQCVKP